jgi:hypothetical protein
MIAKKQKHRKNKKTKRKNIARYKEGKENTLNSQHLDI